MARLEVIETTHLGGQVPTDLAEQFAQVARDHDRSVSAELRRALKAHVDAHKPKAKSA